MLAGLIRGSLGSWIGVYRWSDATLLDEACDETSAMALFLFAASTAQAQTADPGMELAFMPHEVTVTLLNEGGKYVAVDLKHIPEGGTCRMDKDAAIARIGPGAKPGTTRVRYAGVQMSSGGCPFMTRPRICPYRLKWRFWRPRHGQRG
jgi:hypothetical protein